MTSKLCIDLCAGLGGFSSAFKFDSSWDVVTVELNKKHKPTICADVRHLPIRENIQPDCLLMGPPYERNSIACPRWPQKGIGISLEVVGACLEAVVYLKPKAWLMENPKGRLRWFIQVVPKSTVKYCNYDPYYKAIKSTDLWGNVSLPMVTKERKFSVDWNYNMPRNPSQRAEMPLGFSQAVKVGVEQKLLESTAV